MEPALWNEFFKIPVLRKLLEWIHAHVMTIYMYILHKIVISAGMNFDFTIIFNKQGINSVI